MTFTESTMEWLGQNRHRSYPAVRDDWRRFASPESGLDCVLLDALVFDSDAKGDERLLVGSISVDHAGTDIVMSYGGFPFRISLSGGETSGEGSYEMVRGVVRGSGSRGASISLAFSSHAYILDRLGEGSWTAKCPILGSRVVRMSSGTGVDSISVNGSSGVEGHGEPSSASGDVVLEDGYRTSPVISRGEVVVRVGERFGLNPCGYDFGDSASRDCRRPLFFFCGQNGINSGDVSIMGGKGVSVVQGGSYTVDDVNSSCNGKTIPCIEIIAGRELLDICRPSE